MTDGESPLLAPDEPPSVTVERPDGSSPYLLTCDHAGNRIPRRLGTLGLRGPDLEGHVAWDIGAAGVARRLSERLDATLVLQTYSRLVIDCNRPLDSPDSIAITSEDMEIPGNRNLDPVAAEARAREIFHAYHDRIAAALDARQASGQPSLLVAVHSFAPVYKGVRRPWHVGILYGRDGRLAGTLLELLAGEGDLCIGDNEPYSVDDESDYTIPTHGERRGIPHVLIEIRQDLIATAPGQSGWAARLSELLGRACDRLVEAGVT